MGFWNAVLYILSRLLCRLSQDITLNKYYVLACPPGFAGKEMRFCGKYEFRFISSSRELEHERLSQDEIQNRLDAGDCCLACFKDNTLAGYLWINTAGYREIEDRSLFSLGNEQLVWDYDIYVPPEHRAGFVFACLWNEYFNYLKQHKIKYTLSRVSVFNYHSVRSHKGLGARVIFSVVYLKLFSWQISLSGVFPHLFFSVSQATLPQFTLDRILAAKGYDI
jgi:hypothetical protein